MSLEEALSRIQSNRATVFEDHRAEVSAYLFLCSTVEQGNFSLFETLLKDPSLSEMVSIFNNGLLRTAAQNGHVEIVAYLLTLPAVAQKASIKENEALREAQKRMRDVNLSQAMHQRYREIITLLLQVESVHQYEIIHRIEKYYFELLGNLLILAAGDGYVTILKSVVEAEKMPYRSSSEIQRTIKEALLTEQQRKHYDILVSRLSQIEASFLIQEKEEETKKSNLNLSPEQFH